MSLAIVFPGQGSQFVGMLADLGHRPEIRAAFGEASDTLGYDLWALAQEGPEAELNSTERTQPAMLAAGVGLWRVWLAEAGRGPALMAGHSLGEYSALVAANCLDFAAAVRLVAERGRLMQTAVPQGEGAMAALLGLDDDTVRRVCAQAAQGEVVAAANFNAPGQVVIAGHRNAVQRAMDLAREHGAKRAVLLPVSVPSHCSLMAPVTEALSRQLAGLELRTPEIPVLQNLDARARGDAGAIVEALSRQVCQPVRWVDTVAAMASQGTSVVLELGPGRILTGLVKRIDRGLTCHAVSNKDSLSKALAEVEEHP